MNDGETLENAAALDELWLGCDPTETAEPEDEEAVAAPSAAEVDLLINRLSTAASGLHASAPETPIAAVAASPQAPSEPPRREVAPAETQTLASIESLDPELRDAFLDDAAGCLTAMEQALLRMESDPAGTADSLNQIGRELHTLKGASAGVGLSTLVDQLHQLEETLQDDQATQRRPEITALLNQVDSIRCQIGLGPARGSTAASPADRASEQATDSAEERQPQSPASSARFGTVREITDDSPLAPAGRGQGEGVGKTSVISRTMLDDAADDDESVRVRSSQLNRLMDMLAELVMLRNRRQTEVAELQDSYHTLLASASRIRLLGSCGDAQRSSDEAAQLTELANDVLETAQQLRHSIRPLADGNTAVSQFIRQFRQELVELRRTPIAGLFQRLQRVVRDAAQSEAKQVRLELKGEDAAIERSLQQRLYEPLLHILRNSVCHGIELPPERMQAGKPSEGTITLEACSGPDLFVIEIRDDGRGLDYEAIRRRGIQSGLLAADRTAGREELAQLIFQPGFSTRQTADQLAGRGVGMDVVAAALKRMRGWLQVDSQPQQGTRIRLSFPLPSVIQHAMVFRCADQLYAIPMQSVQYAGQAEGTNVVLDIAALLNQDSGDPEQQRQCVVLACEAPQGAAAPDTRVSVTLMVDEIVGPEEVVVRPLPALLKNHPFCCGATLSGFGRTVLMLDAGRLVQSQQHRLRRDAPADSITNGIGRPQSDALRSRPRVLVVDDSRSARLAVVRSLGRYALDITQASDGKQASRLLGSEHFDAVFTDLEMPHFSGLELLEQLNARPAADAPPTVIISSRNEARYTGEAERLGAAGYLVKPLTDEALDQVLAACPSLQRLTQTSHSTSGGEI